MGDRAKKFFSELRDFISVLDEEVLKGKLEDENQRQLEAGVSFVYVNKLLELLVNAKDVQASDDVYKHFDIELKKYLRLWKDIWKERGLDVDISINSIKRI
ncbi:MAG: hypothetical protein J6X11_12870 [Treponema sp.]|nr:hypothetical protein [Treponema sp.]